MTRVLVVAPHPDDETLGCGGTLLRARAEGSSIDWLIMTDMPANAAWSEQRRQSREQEIKTLAQACDMTGVHRLGYSASSLDHYPISQVIDAVNEIVHLVQPDTVYLPFPGDAHSDHAVTYKALCACTKVFRAPFIREVSCYETLSETNFAANPTEQVFRPNMYRDITGYLETKIANMDIYHNEVQPHPFPRSHAAIRALATLRGAEAGVSEAEAFHLIKLVS